MKRFAALFAALDESTSTDAKVEAMVRYFGEAEARDAAWAVYFLAGGKPRQVVRTRELRAFALAGSGLPEWLFDECYLAVGDFAETLALLLPPPARQTTLGLADWIETRLLPLRGRGADEVLAALRGYADELGAAERFLLVKLIGGGFRVGVSRLLVTRALARVAGVDPKQIAQRLIGATDDAATPTADGFRALLAAEQQTAVQGGTPYPFFLAHPLAAPVESLGSIQDWLAEWKYDGIRAQLVRRAGQAWLWSRGEELIGERFPEIVEAAAALDDGTVLDGEVLVWDPDARHPAPFARLQTRITRKQVTPRVLREHPARFIAYDLLEHRGEDQRGQAQQQRRQALAALLAAADAGRGALRLSPLVETASWDELARLRGESRARGVEGLMLKRADARYGVGRTRDVGTWWKWKIDPMSVDAVLVYAQRGHGRRASLYTDYTFAVWDRAPRDAAEAEAVVAGIAAGEKPEASAARGLPRLVPFAKAYSGLTDEEMRGVDAVIRRTTVESFGPVRSVAPSLVLELGFEGIQKSPRHRSGIAVRFPRMLRIRSDKPLHEADTLASLQALLDAQR